jgi:hypothetical protein
MMRAFQALGLIAILSAVALAQPAPKTQIFEAADVHVSPPGANEDGAFLPGGLHPESQSGCYAGWTGFISACCRYRTQIV